MNQPFSGQQTSTEASSATAPSLKQIEDALQTLYTHTDSAMQNEANAWLLQVQRHPLVVPICLELIKSNQPFFSQFFGIQTLTAKVHSDWESMWTDEFRLNIKNTVFNRFLFDVDSNVVINSKLCSCISAIMIHCIPRLWEHSIGDLLTLFHSNQSSERIKKGTLDILTLLPIEFESVVLSNTRRASIKDEFSKYSDRILTAISDYLSQNLNQQLNILLLKCIRGWIRFLNSEAIFKSKLLFNIFKVIENQEVFVEGLSLIGDLINFMAYHSSAQSLNNSIKVHSRDMRTFEEAMVPIIRKLISLKHVYIDACKNDNSYIYRAYAETLSQIVECYAPLMVEILNSDVQQCLSFILEFCQLNREISELTFNAWCFLGDYALDNEQMKKIYAKLLQILMEKSSYSTENNSNNNNNNNENNKNLENGNYQKLTEEEDEAELFDYRVNVCDVIQTSFEIIGGEEFMKYINGLLKNNCKSWQSYEVVYFIIKCVIPYITEEYEMENELITSITTEIILQSFTLPYHPKLSKKILEIIGEFEPFIKQFSDILSKSFNYILTNTQHAQVRDLSLSILKEYSMSDGEVLSKNIDLTLQTLESLYNQVDLKQQKLFIDSILSFLAFASANQKPIILQRLLNPTVTTLKSILSSIPESTNSTTSVTLPPEKLVLLMNKLSILVSSLNFGDDLIPLLKEFTGGIWNILEKTHTLSIQINSIELSDQLWNVFWRIIHELGPEGLFNVDNIFNYLLQTTKHFPHISSSTANIVNLILNTFKSNPIIYIQNLINTIIISSLPILIQNDNQAMPTICRFFQILRVVLEFYPNIFYSSQYAINIIEISSTFLLNHERDSLTSVIDFYNQLFIKMNAHESLLKNFTKPIISNIFISLVNDANRTFTNNFSELLYDWVLKYPNSKVVVVDCVMNANWLPNETPRSERERLAKLIVSLDFNKAKFKSLLTDICQVCNNLMTWDVFLSYEIKSK